MNILLIGNPNVGKSVIFNRLTGVDVISSNYPGTSVDYTRGFLSISGKRHQLIDVPGTYTLEPTCKAEEIAVELLKEGDVVINVIDATNLERSLNLTLQLIKQKIPFVAALNLFDEAEHTGIFIDVEKLECILNVTCIPTCALTGVGISKLVNSLEEVKVSDFDFDNEDRWNTIGNILQEIQHIKHKHHTFLEALRDYSIKPVTGIPILLIIMVLMFLSIRFVSEGIIEHISNPLFNSLWTPVLGKLSALLQNNELLSKLLFGEFNTVLNYETSFGLLTTGLYIPIGIVLPYVFSFYTILALMEDSGYLPRVAVMMDTTMHKAGIHGLSIIPMLLGLGCNVPGALATRILETRKEKFITATLLSIAIPCMALQAMLFGLLGSYGYKGLLIVFTTLVIVWFIVGNILKHTVKGTSPEIFMEIPPYRLPYFKGITKKVFMRIKWFIKEAIPFMLFGVLLANVLYAFNILHGIEKVASPLFVHCLGLPKEAVGVLILGLLRKDLAVGMLIPLQLELNQLIVASVVLAIYFPCVATFSVLIKELGIKDMLKSVLIMLITAILVGTILNQVLNLI
ncbi:ferrous iron transporter B [Plebeiibacterium marinum]|uniref:Ferrous iron transporter B n=1 Tax=Plebeiibacterium marinum TaxID=2992111 RepID=A0AAE3MFQ8_9BACT|nr:ferrous iron transporter B [Plebeiobacterium marinum]MCW3806699.1 ferrous iron transporter B [Plebeiobacterium marinum]